MENTRRTGKSTKAAFEVIAYAIGNPNKWVKVWDHASFEHVKANYNLMQIILKIIHQHNLNMEVDLQKLRFKSLHTGFQLNHHGEMEVIPLPKEQ